MRVETNISRLDLLRFNLTILPRLRLYYILVLFLFGVAFIFSFGEAGVPVGAHEWVVRAAMSVTAALAGFGIMYVLVLFLQLVSARTSRGVIGPHEYILSDDGFRDRTPQTDSFMKWSFILGLITTQSYALVRVSNACFYIIPRRSFPDHDQYQEFIDTIRGALDSK